VLVVASVALASHAAAHPAAWTEPHVGLLLAAAAVNVVVWRVGERDRRRADLVLDATADGIHGIDRDGRITFANAALARMLRTTAEALVGRDHHEALGHVSDDAGACPICTTLTARRDGPCVTSRLRRADGEELPVECTSTPLRESRKVTGAVVTLRDLSERQRLARQALHDPLTGLANRTLLRAHLEQAIAALDRRRHTAALLFCDLDRFKHVNDTYGHAAGDALLVTVAERLQTAVRGHDTVARFGGDEFVVLCTDLTSTHDAITVAERLVEAVGEPVMIDGAPSGISTSIGVTVFDRPDTDPDAILEEADLAMYRAKERGRARVEVFDDGLRERADRRIRMEQDLRRALREREIEVHYQPHVVLADGRLDGVEALARWRHPALGFLAPDDFLPIAEEAGLMPELGSWVLEQACTQVQTWRQEHPRAATLALAVNLSASQLADSRLAEVVDDVLRRTGLPPALLCLEIGELSLASETPTTVETLHALKRLGVRLAVDDFGTGWSSLTYLSRVPIDVLKVDRSFVASIDRPGDSWSIVAAAMGLSRSLGLAIVAEGVERQAQADVLEELGYEMAQGYHFHHPLPPADLERLLEGSRVRRGS
jgi:diguanylate cyclase (GGDEF)-like protein/PAS domain S-box-containing protein